MKAAAAEAERLAAEKARAERAAEEKDVATKRKKQEADLARAKAEIESVAAEAQARADADRKAAVLFRDTVLYAIVTPSIVREKINTGNDRQKLVQASLKAWPALRRFNASYQLDSSCTASARRMTSFMMAPACEIFPRAAAAPRAGDRPTRRLSDS